MGTLAALAPVVLGIGEATDISLPLLAGVLVSGAMFGDNLSIISDTTIAATRTQGCTMRDKFRANLKIAIPAAIVTILWLVTYDTSEAPLKIPDANLWLSLPYFAIIVLAVMGLNVFAVLGLGIVLAAAFGMFTVDYEWVAFSQDIYKGFESMQEIFLLSYADSAGYLRLFASRVVWRSWLNLLKLLRIKSASTNNVPQPSASPV